MRTPTGQRSGDIRRIVAPVACCLLVLAWIAGTAHLAAPPVRAFEFAGDVRERHVECIAITVYAEARGEPLDGKAAVAWTVVNRVRQTGADPCTVVLEPTQFVALDLAPVQSYLRAIAAGRPYSPAYANTPAHMAALNEARHVARSAYAGQGHDPSNGALNFLASEWEHRVSPGHWSRSMLVTARIGNHIFMRPYTVNDGRVRVAARVAPAAPAAPPGLFNARLAEAFASMISGSSTDNDGVARR